MLIASAVFAICSIGLITTKFKRMFTETNISTTKPTKGIMNSCLIRSARMADAAIGMDANVVEVAALQRHVFAEGDNLDDLVLRQVDADELGAASDHLLVAG